ncbi:hypothetical protein WMY93_003992 [Mugilogobius chulae]|uniref:Uncharacterized protein n=1 Tax=Mugilogobius chulae TaxID=88201 RepID=A0AAW0PWZ4_9GOBI
MRASIPLPLACASCVLRTELSQHKKHGMHTQHLGEHVTENRLLMAPTEEADRSEGCGDREGPQQEGGVGGGHCLCPGGMGGDPGDEILVAGSLQAPDGKVPGFSGEEERDNPLSANKHLFLKYKPPRSGSLVEEVEGVQEE